MKTLNELFRDVIFLNEVGGNDRAILRFSDPDGPSGRSGWSFGLCQFDTRHNSDAIACLLECGYSVDEIDIIVKQQGKPDPSKLKADIVARYDEEQLSRCLYAAMNSVMAKGVLTTNSGAILGLADYVNQYGSIGDGFAAYLDTLDNAGDQVTLDEIHEWKLQHTKYGREHPDDCKRRYNNILAVLKREGLDAA